MHQTTDRRVAASGGRSRATIRRRAAALVTIVAALVLAGAGCGGSDGADDALPEPMVAETSASTSTTTTRPTDDRIEVVTAGVHQMNADGRWGANWAAVLRNTRRIEAAGGVTVTVDFLDADGEVVHTETTGITLIWPDRSGAVTSVVDAPGAVTVAVSVEVDEWLSGYDVPLGLELGPVVLSELPRTFENDPLSIRLEAILTSSYPEDISVIITAVFHDPSGAVMGGAEAEIQQFDVGFVISPGQSLPWMAQTPMAIPPDWTIETYLNPVAPSYFTEEEKSSATA